MAVDSPSLDTLLNTLPASSSWSLGNSSVLKPETHLTLLDGLALLFVRSSTQDVAAICMTRDQLFTEQNVTFWLAMNAGYDEKLKHLLN